MSEIRLEKISKSYDSIRAVKNLTLTIHDGEFMVFVGPSGCGKSTTLRLIAGLETLDDGEIYIAGQNMKDFAPKDRDVAMVFQNFALYPHLSSFENMAFGLRLRDASEEEIQKRVTQTSRMLEIEDLLDRKPSALSGGQRQRVALGRAIVRDPKAFLMDEPLSNLDAKLRVQMRAELERLHNKLKTTVIYVTHDQAEAMTMADRMAVMKDGEIQQIGPPLEVYDAPANIFVGGFIGSPEMNFLNVGLIEEGGDYWIDAGSFRLVVPELVTEKYQDLEQYVGKEIIMGIRPEALYDADLVTVDVKDQDCFEAKIEVSEPMGSETHLYITSNSHELRAVVERSEERVEMSSLRVYCDMSEVHFFDKDTEKRI